MDAALLAYLPEDRRAALARGADLPTHAEGSALFADIAGFTPLTEALVETFGPRGGGELLSHHLNSVYDALVDEVDRFRGSVVFFNGDSITCWFEESFDGPSAPLRASACALAMQAAMRRFSAIAIAARAVTLALKVTVASGPARRFQVGNSSIQLLDVLAGAPVERTADAERFVTQGEVLLDEDTVAALSHRARVAAWRADPHSGRRYALLGGLAEPVAPTPWPGLAEIPAERLREWVLPAILERRQAGLGFLLTELRPCAICFVRFGGIDYDDDPDAGERLDALVRRIQEALARYEGTLLQISVGDKGSYFSAVFGAPAAHEDDPLRALNAALELQALAPELELPPLQAGISQGTLRVGDYGGVSRRTYGVLGDEVNLAARLMMLARPGETLVSGRMQLLVAEAFALEPRPPIAIKGKAEPLPVFAVSGRRRRRAIRLEEPDYQLPMVGRDPQLARLVGLMDQALAGSGQVVAVVGDAGMGKSRLVAELVRVARQRGFAGYGGSCQVAGVRSPYMVWETIWRAFFDLDPDAPLRRQVRQIERVVEDLAPERADAIPLLGPLLGVKLAENDVTRELEPQFRRALLHALLLDCLRVAAIEAQDDTAGLLLVLDDLHWIDPASDELLLEVAGAVADLPVLIVLAYRPTELLGVPAPRVERLGHCTRIDLGPIAHDEAAQVIRAKLAQLFAERVVGAPPALVARITALAQGNPFYVEELLSYLRDRGIDPRDSLAINALDLPTSLHTLVLSRLDQLSSRQQATLKAASVIGRRFLVAWLQGAFPPLTEVGPLHSDLTELARLELTSLDTAEPELAYLFKHIVTREVAYESVSPATRAALHEQLAAYLEAASEGDDRYVDLLAYHYELSENLAKKRLYLRRAAEVAAARFATTESLAYIARALDLAPPDDYAERAALLTLRERLLDILGDRDGQTRDIESLEQIALATGDDRLRAAAVTRRINLADRYSDYALACAEGERAVAIASRAGATATAVEAYQLWTWALLHTGDYDQAQEKAEAALALALTIDDPRSARAAYNSLGGVSEFRSEYHTAREHYDRVLQLSRRIGDRRAESGVLNNLGNIARNLRELELARSYLEQSVAGFRTVGDRRGEGVARTDLGQVAAEEMNVQEAYRQYEQALAIAQAVGDREGEAWTLCALGNVARSWGDYDVARGYYERALAMFSALGMASSVSLIETFIAICAVRQGDAATALAQGQAGAETAHTIGDAGLESLARTVVANARELRGELAEAEAGYRAAIDLRVSLGWSHGMLDAWAGLARVALATGDLPTALSYAEKIMDAFVSGVAHDGVGQPARVGLTVYDVLVAAGDPRADAALHAAHERLLARAARIDDATLRAAYLEGTPSRRRLRELWARRQPERSLGESPAAG